MVLLLLAYSMSSPTHAVTCIPSICQAVSKLPMHVGAIRLYSDSAL